MDPKTPESLAADALLAEELTTASSDEPQSPSHDEMRLARIRELQIEALAKPKALQACLSSSTSDLFLIGWRLQQRVTAALATGAGTVDELTTLMPALDALLRVGRQVDRYLQAEARITAADRQSEATKLKLQAATLGGLTQEVKRRKPGLIPTQWKF